MADMQAKSCGFWPGFEWSLVPGFESGVCTQGSASSSLLLEDSPNRLQGRSGQYKVRTVQDKVRTVKNKVRTGQYKIRRGQDEGWTWHDEDRAGQDWLHVLGLVPLTFDRPHQSFSIAHLSN